VAAGRRREWEPNSGGYVSHPCMQLDRAYGSRLAWHVVIGDINRLARYWLDGWHGDENGGVAA